MKKEKCKRPIIKNVRFSEKENETVTQYAKRCGLSFSAYARMRILGYRPQAKDLTLAINQLSKQGGLLKDLHNKGLGHSELTIKVLKSITQAIFNLEREARSKEKAQTARNPDNDTQNFTKTQ